jgi:hypothetical protein
MAEDKIPVQTDMSSLILSAGKNRVVTRCVRRCYSVRPKARWLAQHGGPPGWLEESDPAGVILPYRTGCPDRTCPAAS